MYVAHLARVVGDLADGADGSGEQPASHLGDADAEIVADLGADADAARGRRRCGVYRDVFHPHLVFHRPIRRDAGIVGVSIMEDPTSLPGGFSPALHQVHAADRTVARFVRRHVGMHRADVTRLRVQHRMLLRGRRGDIFLPLAANGDENDDRNDQWASVHGVSPVR